MTPTVNIPLVKTIQERCRVCYTCVRECPAKAIRISGGQAEVLIERCIGCGNCVRVCSQQAKEVLCSIGEVRRLLDSPNRVAACLAPSFPAEFENTDYLVMVGMIRALGFDLVNEVGFGADLVANRYRKLLSRRDGKRYIATSCPAVVSYVERYHPELVPSLAPIVSPMLALARVLHVIHGENLQLVFIGPCIAKKAEAAHLNSSIDAVLTFAELRQMFSETGIEKDAALAQDFDPPHAGYGALFPITRGMLQAANIDEDLMRGEVVSADGRSNFVEAIKEFESGDLDARLLEILCCDGCIMGPGITNHIPLFSRRSRVSRFIRERMQTFDRPFWFKHMERFAELDLSQEFMTRDQRVPLPAEKDLRDILARMGKEQPQDELNCGACGYDTCREHAIAIYRGLAESEMCLPYTIDQLRKTVQELAVSNEDLARVQEALVHSEKLASMGQLAAGIAHEVNNPLGVVLMYAHLLLDKYASDPKMGEDLRMIVEHTDRCKKIVSGLLNFARQSRVVTQPTDLSELVDHCLRLISLPESITLEVKHLGNDAIAEVDSDQISQVLSNLVSNAVAAMQNGGTLRVETAGDNGHIRLTVQDTGTGIPKQNLQKIYEPFFSTKQMGRGTGLGLAVTYGIVKMHRGDIQAESNADPAAGPTGSTFTIILPRSGQQT